MSHVAETLGHHCPMMNTKTIPAAPAKYNPSGVRGDLRTLMISGIDSLTWDGLNCRIS